MLMIFLNLAIKPFWILGIDRVSQLRLGLDVYGSFYPIYNLTLWLSVILDPGLHIFLNTTLSKKTEVEWVDYYRKSIPFKMLLSIVFGVLTLFIGLLLGYSNLLLILELLIVNQILASLILFFRAGVSAKQNFNADALFSVLDRILMIIFCGIGLYVPSLIKNYTLNYFVLAQTFAYLGTLILVIISKYYSKQLYSLKLDYSFIRSILKKSLPFALLGVLMTLYTRMDAIMIEKLSKDGIQQSGIYASAYRLLDALNNIAYLFSVILIPILGKLLSENKPTEIKNTISNYSKLLFIPSILIVITTYFMSHPIMNMLYHNQNSNTLEIVFAFLMPTLLCMCSVYIYGGYMTVAGQIGKLNWMAAFSLVINFILNLFLIVRFGAFGAVIATLVTQGINASFLYFYYLKHTKKGYSGLNTLKFASLVILSILLFILLRSTDIDWFIQIGIVWIVGFTFATLLGIFPLNQIKGLLKTNRT